MKPSMQQAINPIIAAEQIPYLSSNIYNSNVSKLSSGPNNSLTKRTPSKKPEHMLPMMNLNPMFSPADCIL